jgi:uncharacterized phage protein (TIGR02220 family)
VKIKPKKWEEFQHYKDIHYAKGAKPAWVKLHRKLLDDFEYQSLPVASRALAPMLWLIASEDPQGVIDATPEKLAFRLRWTGPEISEALSPLIGKGFFDVVQFPQGDPRVSLEPVYSASRSEKKREEEKREETPIVPLKRDGMRSLASQRRNDALHILEFLNGRAGRHFKPVPANLRFIEQRLAEGVTVQDLKTLTVRKCGEWLGTDMEKFLRPETLFNATKCHSYLGDIPPEAPKGGQPCNASPATDRSPPAPENALADGHSPAKPRSASTQNPSVPEPAHGSPPADAAAFLVH